MDAETEWEEFTIGSFVDDALAEVIDLNRRVKMLDVVEDTEYEWTVTEGGSLRVGDFSKDIWNRLDKYFTQGDYWTIKFAQEQGTVVLFDPADRTLEKGTKVTIQRLDQGVQVKNKWAYAGCWDNHTKFSWVGFEAELMPLQQGLLTIFTYDNSPQNSIELPKERETCMIWTGIPEIAPNINGKLSIICVHNERAVVRYNLNPETESTLYSINIYTGEILAGPLIFSTLTVNLYLTNKHMYFYEKKMSQISKTTYNELEVVSTYSTNALKEDLQIVLQLTQLGKAYILLTMKRHAIFGTHLDTALMSLYLVDENMNFDRPRHVLQHPINGLISTGDDVKPHIDHVVRCNDMFHLAVVCLCTSSKPDRDPWSKKSSDKLKTPALAWKFVLIQTGKLVFVQYFVTEALGFKFIKWEEGKVTNKKYKKNILFYFYGSKVFKRYSLLF